MDNKIGETIKRLRKERRITHKSMAERLHMARSTYSKLESGHTKLGVERLTSISKVLDVPLQEIYSDPISEDIATEIEIMFRLTEDCLSQEKYSVVPFKNLSPENKRLLKEKGFETQEEYENTPLGGRVFNFGPKRLFKFMVENCGMAVVFERNLVKDEFLISRWKKYLSKKNGDETEIDEHDYFTVFMYQLKLPGGKEKYYQYAVKDFPEGADEIDTLEYMKLITGALDGDIVCFMTDGYCPATDIFPPTI